MALLLLWQLASVVGRQFFDENVAAQFLWSVHKEVGVALFSLIVIRALWAFVNASNRPPSVSSFARIGHLLLYVLMLFVPLVALIRQYGSGRAFEPFGFSLFSGFEGDRVDWMVSLGSDFHGDFGWIMFALIFGHIAMALYHRYHKKQKNIMSRMI